jgi:hypothetical protein
MPEVLLPTFGRKQPAVGLGCNRNIEPLRGSFAGIAIHPFRGFHPRLLRFDAFSVGAAATRQSKIPNPKSQIASALPYGANSAKLSGAAVNEVERSTTRLKVRLPGVGW